MNHKITYFSQSLPDANDDLANGFYRGQLWGVEHNVGRTELNVCAEDATANAEWHKVGGGLMSAEVEFTLTTSGFSSNVILAAPGANRAIQVIDTALAVFVTSTLDAGAQNLELQNAVSNDVIEFFANAQIETASNALFYPQTKASSRQLRTNEGLIVALSSGVNPVAGNVRMILSVLFRIFAAS